MNWAFLALMAATVLIILGIRRYMLSRIPYKHPITTEQSRPKAAPVFGPEPCPMVDPFVIFNEIPCDRAEKIADGTAIASNYYIISGEVGLYREGERDEPELITVIGYGASVYNCFDLLGLQTGTVKRARGDLLAVPVPGHGSAYITASVLEKTCLQPLLEFFELPSHILAFERLRCADFLSFVKAYLREQKAIKREHFSAALCLDECLVWVESGVLTVDGIGFGRGRLVGILGLLFNSCRRRFSLSAEAGTVIQYVSYSKVLRLPAKIYEVFLNSIIYAYSGMNRESQSTAKGQGLSGSEIQEESSFNHSELDSNALATGDTKQQNIVSYLDANCDAVRSKEPLDRFTLLVGMSCRWRRLKPNHQLVAKDGECNEVYLLDDRELGTMECMRGQGYAESYTTDKVADAVRVPREAIEERITMDRKFYRLMLDRMFSSGRRDCKTVLMTAANASCEEFVLGLAGVLGDECVLVSRSAVFTLLRGREPAEEELLLTNYLRALKRKHRVVLVYIENNFSKSLELFARSVDLIYVAGFEPILNRFDRANVEFVQLHTQRKQSVPMLIKLQRRLFSKRADGSSTSEEENAEDESAEPDRNNNDGGLEKQSIFSPQLVPSEHSITRRLLQRRSARTRRAAAERGISCNPLNLGDLSNVRRYKRIHHVLCMNGTGYCTKDFERLKRYLLGDKVGLVLGGGGARGFAHIGVIRALEEENIPIDCIGGTSMGAFVGALYARELDFLKVFSESRQFARAAASRWTFFWDWTYPFVSMFTGRSLVRALNRFFGKLRIQDLWLEFYCVATNLIQQEEKVVFSGRVARWVCASMSICGLLPPRIIRNEYFVDGAYMNNVPADVMKQLNARIVIAVDVCESSGTTSDPYDSPSGFVLLLKQLFRRKRYISIFELQYRLAFLSTEAKIRALDTETLLIRPELGAIRTSDFHRFEEIIDRGYVAAKAAIAKWRAKGLISSDIRRRVRRNSI
ncbi:lysophospholipid hydrolase [Pancytospora philotis]|nr:lysophospholipid hydrolase [Pancytospora philotis]